MTTAMLGINQQAQEVQGRAFNYDQLYRLKESRTWHMTSTNAANNNWGTTTTDGRYHEKFSYDWNGNITRAERWGNQVVAGQAVKMDDLTYQYAANSNVLQKLTETVAACLYSGDLDPQTAATNYTYDPLGSLISDLSERITAMEWNSAGKLKAVKKDQAANGDPCNTSQELADADVDYLYTVSGQRLCKIVKPHLPNGGGIAPQEKWEYYWYAYERSGIPMAIYKQTYEAQQSAWKVKFEVEEHNLFGSGRVGVRHGDDLGKTWQTFSAAVVSGRFTNLSYTGGNVLPLITHYERRYGAKQYELSNHLGNVLATVSDKRLPYSAVPLTATVVDRYLPDVLSYGDYYAFGASQPGRVGGEYRYGFNGMEMDKEPKGGAGLSYTTEFRQYDPRVGRWFSPDPVVKVSESPYAAFYNNPIVWADPSGLDPGGGDPINLVTQSGGKDSNGKPFTYYSLDGGKTWSSTPYPGTSEETKQHFQSQAQKSDVGFTYLGDNTPPPTPRIYKSNNSKQPTNSSKCGPTEALESKNINQLPTSEGDLSLREGIRDEYSTNNSVNMSYLSEPFTSILMHEYLNRNLSSNHQPNLSLNDYNDGAGAIDFVHGFYMLTLKPLVYTTSTGGTAYVYKFSNGFTKAMNNQDILVMAMYYKNGMHVATNTYGKPIFRSANAAKHFRYGKLMKAAGNALFFVQLGTDIYDAAAGNQTWAKAGLNTTFGLIGMYGGIPGLIIAGVYFLVDATIGWDETFKQMDETIRENQKVNPNWRLYDPGKI